ncbi:MAG: RDD family protein [Armatimonadetes bacterium]|nr:RDD family protein [Armatimonadota bacterium]
MYTVVDAQGNSYGPVSLEDLTKWYQEGRIAPTSMIHDTTGAATPPAQFFGQAAAAPAAPAQPAPFGQAPPSTPQNFAQPAGQPGAQGGAYYRPPDNFFAASNYAGEADLGKRFVGLLIDVIPVIILSFLLAMMFRPAVSVTSGPGGFGAAVTYSYTYYLISAILFGGYLLIRDCLAGPGQSFGKKIAGTRCITESGAPFTMVDSVKRNIASAIGSFLQLLPFLLVIAIPISGVVGLIELVLVIMTKQRIGDKLFKYHVVNA